MNLSSNLYLKVSINGERDLLPVLNCIFNFGHKNGLNPVDICKVVTATSELGTNLCKYAKNGSLEVTMKPFKHEVFAEVISKDLGPGINDISEAIEDNFTTGSTLGLGLAAVKRLMDDFSLISSPEGTIVSTQKRIKIE